MATAEGTGKRESYIVLLAEMVTLAGYRLEGNAGYAQGAGRWQCSVGVDDENRLFWEIVIKV